MSDLWIGDVGIRVTNLERSIEFYTKVFDLDEIDRGGDDEGKYVLFRDRRSGQRVELNWYAEESPFWAPYVPGEALGHFEVREAHARGRLALAEGASDRVHPRSRWHLLLPLRPP